MAISAAALLLLATDAHADQVPIGVISYDVNQVDTLGNPTITAFDIANLTGDPSLGGYSLPPDFGVFTFLNFATTTLTLTGTSAPGSPISLGTIASGFLQDSSGNPPASLLFGAGSTFSSALLTGTLDTTSITLSDGTALVLDPQFSVFLGPSSGGSLVAGVDFATIYAETAPPVTTPEPGSASMLTLGLMMFGGIALRNLRGKYRVA
jgi:hypothetical protein